jgi:hypothetical protein
VLDESERIEDFREIEPAELLTVVDKLSHLDTSYNEELQGQVRDWGIFRAVIHQMVWEALQG